MTKNKRKRLERKGLSTEPRGIRQAIILGTKGNHTHSYGLSTKSFHRILKELYDINND